MRFSKTVNLSIRTVAVVFFFTALFHSPISAQSYNKDTEKYVSSIQKKYAKYKGYEVNFKMKMKFPDGEAQEFKGNYWSNAEKFKIDLPDQAIYCNGKGQWMLDKAQNTVSINDVDEGGFSISPQAIFDMLNSTEYSYALSFSGQEDGTKVDKIEFKPNDDYSDFSKARLTLASKDKTLKTLETFYKDGSRMLLTIVDLKESANEDEFFEFIGSEHGNPEVEDLRLD